jgi:hypothetical protein
MTTSRSEMTDKEFKELCGLVNLAHADLTPLLSEAVEKSSLRLSDDDEMFDAHTLGHVTALLMKAVQVRFIAQVAVAFYGKHDLDAFDDFDWDQDRAAFMRLAGDMWDDWMGMAHDA